ncbi:MAG: hypothetical protein IEMM0008_0924 [bacterium]|nr:MAG: hypothetical protein IEMM0008_0924 [bacterium]
MGVKNIVFSKKSINIIRLLLSTLLWLKENYLKKLMSLFLLIVFLSAHSFTDATVTQAKAKNLTDNKLNDSFLRSWSHRFFLITPVKKINLNTKNAIILRFLQQNDILKNLYTKTNIHLKDQIVFQLDENPWKEKYFALLYKLSKHSKAKPVKIDPSTYKIPKAYNLVIISYDLVPPDKNFVAYCKVYINRKLAGESHQGLLTQKKVIRLKVKEAVQHMLFLEKYQFDKRKRRWERMRNLLQPKRKYFRVPKGRIRVIEIIYDASKERPDLAHLKYRYLTHFMTKNEEIK